MKPVDLESLESRMRHEGLEPLSWSSLAKEHFAPHQHDFDKVLVVAEGNVTFGLPGSDVGLLLTPGERLDLPANTVHDALVGHRGVTCLEAHLPAGTLGAAAIGRGNRW